MQLTPGDRVADSAGEWEVVGRPYTTAGGKNARVRVQRVNQPGVTEVTARGVDCGQDTTPKDAARKSLRLAVVIEM